MSVPMHAMPEKSLLLATTHTILYTCFCKQRKKRPS